MTKDLQNSEKEKRAAELVIANEELVFQNSEKEKRAAELAIANKELAFQNAEKEKRADELAIANEELAFQNAEKEKRADELAIANEELAFQNAEKEKRAAELAIANKELVFQNAEKEKRAAELVLAKEKRAVELEQHKCHLEKLVLDLEAKNAELEHFTYTVSHDLKAPLVTIGGFINFLTEDICKGNEQQVEADISRIKGAVETMRQLLDQLLSLSRIGRVVNLPENIDMKDLVDGVIDGFKEQIKTRGIQIKVESAFTTVSVDLVRLREVVQNLLENAIKFMGDQPNPIIEVGMKDSNKREYVFYMRDNGMGVEEKFHVQIFGLFNRLNPGATEGTGVGLFSSKRIIEAHGGNMWVESDGLGMGSTFYFSLPKLERGRN